MKLKELFNKMFGRNKAFVAMQADQQKKAVANTATDDTDNMTDEQLGLKILVAEIECIQKSAKSRAELMSRTAGKAFCYAASGNKMDFKLAKDDFQKWYWGKHNYEHLVRLLKRAYKTMAGTEEYNMAEEMLAVLMRLAEYADKKATELEKVWDHYHPPKEREQEPPTMVKERELEEEDWEREF